MHTPLTCSVCEEEADRVSEVAGRHVCDDCAMLALRDIMDDLMETDS